MQDHYETLQVHPRADTEAIRAAYERLRQRYDPSKLEGAADELIELAHTVLSDPQRRRQYDAELAERTVAPLALPAAAGAGGAAGDLIDYRPLPPARRQERPKGFNAQPALPPAQAHRQSAGRQVPQGALPPWLPPVLIVAVATFAVVLVTLLTTVDNQPAAPATAEGPADLGQPAAAAPTPTTEEIVNRFEGQIVAARQVATQVPDNVNAWIELGHALYDSTVVVRERLGSGDQSLQNIYIERLPRWLEAADAYRKALAIQPADAQVRADLAASLCYYGADANDQGYVTQGIAEAEQALAAQPEDGRVLLSMGLCLVSADPPQTQRALEQWQRLVVLPNADQNLVFQARQLIEEYSR